MPDEYSPEVSVHRERLLPAETRKTQHKGRLPPYGETALIKEISAGEQPAAKLYYCFFCGCAGAWSGALAGATAAGCL